MKQKSKLIIIIACIIIFSINIISLAANNTCTVSLSVDKTEVKKGETVTVLVNVSDIQGDGIAMFNANVVYDANAFDCIASGTDSGEWTMQGFIGNNLTTARADLEVSTKNQTVAKIQLKAKENITLGEKTISLQKIEFTTETTSFNVNDVNTKITVIADTGSGSGQGTGGSGSGQGTGGSGSGQGTGGSGSGQGTSGSGSGQGTGGSGSGQGTSGSGSGQGTSGSGSGQGTSGSGSEQKVTSGNGSGSASLSQKTLPYAGTTIVLFISIVVAGIVAVICYIKYKRTY